MDNESKDFTMVFLLVVVTIIVTTLLLYTIGVSIKQHNIALEANKTTINTNGHITKKNQLEPIQCFTDSTYGESYILWDYIHIDNGQLVNTVNNMVFKAAMCNSIDSETIKKLEGIQCQTSY